MSSQGGIFSMVPTADMADAGGVVRPGEIAEAAAFALERCATDGAIFDLKLSFISPARVGEHLSLAAKVVHAGRRTKVVECEILGPDGLVATASGTFAITREKE